MSSLDTVLAAGLALLALAYTDSLYAAGAVLVGYAVIMAALRVTDGEGGGRR